MGAACASAQQTPLPPSMQYPCAVSPAGVHPRRSTSRGLNASRPLSRALSHAQHQPVIIDTDTHNIKALSASQFQILEVTAGSFVPSRSPTRRPIVISRDNSVKRVSAARQRLDKPTEILYRDLTFKQVLGSGTYGEVSRGYWKGRKVAIKKIFPGTNSKERMEVVADFDREMAILTKLKNPRIVQYFGGVNERDQPLCLVFELCEGSASLLLKMVRRGQVLPTWRVCLGILRDAAEAMHYLHSQTPRIIHRDLKSENLLLDSDFRAKLTDFGLSRPFDSRRPQQMTVCGTPCWVAPEIFRNEAYDEKVDIYSFGVLIWETLAAKKPYGDKDCADLPVLVGSKGLRPGPLAHVPDELNQLMAACWDESPSRRPDIEKVRKWLDYSAMVVDLNRRMSTPVHVAHQLTNPWQSPATSFDWRPPTLSDNKRFSVQRKSRNFPNDENRNRRQESENYISLANV